MLPTVNIHSYMSIDELTQCRQFPGLETSETQCKVSQRSQAGPSDCIRLSQMQSINIAGFWLGFHLGTQVRLDQVTTRTREKFMIQFKKFKHETSKQAHTGCFSQKPCARWVQKPRGPYRPSITLLVIRLSKIKFQITVFL